MFLSSEVNTLKLNGMFHPWSQKGIQHLRVQSLQMISEPWNSTFEKPGKGERSEYWPPLPGPQIASLWVPKPGVTKTALLRKEMRVGSMENRSTLWKQEQSSLLFRCHCSSAGAGAWAAQGCWLWRLADVSPGLPSEAWRPSTGVVSVGGTCAEWDETPLVYLDRPACGDQRLRRQAQKTPAPSEIVIEFKLLSKPPHGLVGMVARQFLQSMHRLRLDSDSHLQMLFTSTWYLECQVTFLALSPHKSSLHSILWGPQGLSRTWPWAHWSHSRLPSSADVCTDCFMFCNIPELFPSDIHPFTELMLNKNDLQRITAPKDERSKPISNGNGWSKSINQSINTAMFPRGWGVEKGNCIPQFWGGGGTRRT